MAEALATLTTKDCLSEYLKYVTEVLQSEEASAVEDYTYTHIAANLIDIWINFFFIFPQ